MKERPEYPGKNNHILVHSVDELKRILDREFQYIAWDTETSSLSPEDGELVGFSFAFDSTEGYYVPLSHYMGDNLPKEALDCFYETLLKAKMTFVYNMRFDFRWMEYQGYDMSKVRYYDVAVGVWLSDTNVKFPSLKQAEKQFLGWVPSTFEEVLGEATSFRFLDPEDAYQYAATDAEGTFGVCNATIKFFKEAKIAGKLENESLYPLMKYEEEKLKIDMDYLRLCIEEETQRLYEIQQEIYKIFGYQIKLNSNKQLGEALQQLGIHTGVYTKTGLMKTDIKTLERVNITNPHPVLGMIIEQSQINKSLSSYFESLLKESERMDGWARFSYLSNNVPTGRLSCGSDKKNPFFTHINIQSAPKPHPQNWYVHDYIGQEVRDGEFVILDWLFSTERRSHRVIEGFNQKNNFRSVFVAEDDEYWLSCDYSGEELRIIANLTHEPNWVNTFLTGGDLHKSMAISMWGVENYDKEKRKKAKILNFGMAYGMSGYSLAQKFGVTVEEGEDIVSRFWKAAPRIKEFQNRCVKRARKTGVVYNYFGLPRRVKYYLSSSDPKQRAFGVRTVNNTVIQSMGACVLKLAFVKLWKNLLGKEEYKDVVRFQNTVHDEINFVVKKDRFQEVLNIVYNNMRTEVPGWRVPLEVGVDIGTKWGATFPFKMKEDGMIIPDWEEIEVETTESGS